MSETTNYPAAAKVRTVEVPKEVMVKFKKSVGAFLTKKDCIQYYGLTYTTLKNVMRFGTCHPDTLEKIHAGLERQNTAA